MPHQCVKCGTMYKDASQEILKGCSCGAKLFFFIRKEAFEKKETQVNLSPQDKEQIENDVYDLIGSDIDRSKPVILDIETIKILKLTT